MIMRILQKKTLNSNSLAAMAITAVFSLFLLVNFSVGFSLWLYVIAAIIGLGLSLAQPRAGILALVLLTLIWAKQFTLQSFWFNEVEYKLYLVDIILLGVYFGLMLRMAAQKINPNTTNEFRILQKIALPDVLLFLFMALATVYFGLSVTVWHGEFALAFSSFKNYLFYPLLYFAVAALFNKPEHYQTLFKFFITGAIISLSFVVYGLINGVGLWTAITPLSTAGSRILDFDHAFYLSLATIMLVSYLVVNKKEIGTPKGVPISNSWLPFLLPLFLIGIIGSLMRHLWLALVLTLPIYYWLLQPSERQRLWFLGKKYLAGLIMALAIVVLLVFSLPLSDFSSSLKQSGAQLSNRAWSLADSGDTSIAWRQQVWQGTMKEYWQRRFYGLGFGQMVFLDMGNYRDYVQVRDMHNSWLAVLAQLGPLGLILLWGLMAATMIKAGKFISFGVKIRGRGPMPPQDINLPAKINQVTIRTAQLATSGILVFCFLAFFFQPYLEANWFTIIFWLNLGLMRGLLNVTPAQAGVQELNK